MDLIEFLMKRYSNNCPKCKKKLIKKSPVAAVCYNCRIIFTSFLDDFANLVVAQSPLDNISEEALTVDDVKILKQKIQDATSTDDILGL